MAVQHSSHQEGMPGVKSTLAIVFLGIATVATLTWWCLLVWLMYRLVWAIV